MSSTAVKYIFLIVVVVFSACRGLEDLNVDGSFDRVVWGTHSPFILTSQGNHKEVDCNVCHGPFDTFRQFTCLTSSCHLESETNSDHTSVSGYEFVSSSCFSCHPSGEANDLSRDEHSSTLFPISQGSSHMDLACVECHTDINDYSVVSCTGCHEHRDSKTNPEHAGIKSGSYGYLYSTAACIQCHADSVVKTISSHNSQFPISSGDHRAQLRGCTDCHNKMRSDRPYPATDFTKFSCLGAGCHEHAQNSTNNAHSGVGGYSPSIFTNETWGNCLSCHPSGEQSSLISVAVHTSTKFPISSGSAHESAMCADCHTNASNYSVVTCLNCHDSATTNSDHSGIKSGIYGYQYTTAACLDCHPDSVVKTISSHNSLFPVSSGRHRAQIRGCTDCHNKTRSDRSYQATDFTKFSCLGAGCHEHTQNKTNGQHGGVGGYSSSIFTNETWGNCVSCHPNGNG
ncbi:MAG: hypothetical protein KDD52_00730 [Bdellovibrionales bacterium]|nr:hypothetical protein [Bdellovibrionales bacterium]